MKIAAGSFYKAINATRLYIHHTKVSICRKDKKPIGAVLQMDVGRNGLNGE